MRGINMAQELNFLGLPTQKQLPQRALLQADASRHAPRIPDRRPYEARFGIEEGGCGRNALNTVQSFKP
jgi:hypothetical protein